LIGWLVVYPGVRVNFVLFENLGNSFLIYFPCAEEAEGIGLVAVKLIKQFA